MYRANKQSTPSTPALQEILACRVCLATTGKMFCLENCGLTEAFFDITGIQVSLGDGLPQHVCYICCGLLQKAREFYKRSHSTQSFLSDLRVPLTLDLVQQINSMHGKQLIRTNVIYVSIGEEEIELSDDELEDDLNNTETDLCDTEYSLNDSEMRDKESYSINNEIEDDVSEFMKFNQRSVELTDTNNLCDYKESKDDLTPVLTLQSDRKIKNKKPSTQKIDLADIAKIRSILKNPCNELHKKILHMFIKTKYINKTGDDESEMDGDKSISELIVTTENNISSNSDMKVNKFYDYLRDRYGYIDAEREAVAKRPILDSVAKKSDEVVLEPKSRLVYAAKMAMEFENKYNFKVVRFSREEQIKNMRERMESDKYRDAEYKCEDCYTGFQYKHKYLTHRAKHDPAISGSIECEACKLRFPSNRLYFIHVNNCHRYGFNCKVCDRSFRSRHHAREHYKKHDGSAGYQCKYCSAAFRWRSCYQDHLREKHGTLSCDICHTVLRPTGLPLHMKLMHKKTFKCQSCGKVFHDAAALENHIKTTPNKVCNPNCWPCTKCGVNFSSESLLKEHISKLRTIRKPGPRCLVTERRGTSGTSDRKLNSLQNRKFYGYRFMCELCGRFTFSCAAQLREHMRIHTGDKPFACPTCDKRFRLKINLKIHIRAHSGDKPYKCPDCEKGFTLLSNARRHQLTVHQNIRPYTCNICKKSYHDKSFLNIHIRTVHMKIPRPPRIRNRKRKIEVPEEEKRIMSPKIRKRVVDTEKDDKVDGSEGSEDRTGDFEEAVIIVCEENEEVEFLEEWPDSE